MDIWRRNLGYYLELSGLGPKETPSSRTDLGRGLALRRYGSTEPARPALLLIPAPIKRYYIWDLAPGASVVRHALTSGFRVYLLEWPYPGPDDADRGLADYTDDAIGAAVATIVEDTGNEKLVVAGHSLGGTLAAIYATLHPQHLAGLILVGAPLDFSSGALTALAHLTPASSVTSSLLPAVPGSWLSQAAAIAAPEVFLTGRWWDAAASFGDPRRSRLHLQVYRWMLDELPMPRRLFSDVVEDLYRANRFSNGTLAIRDRMVSVRDIELPWLVAAEAVSRTVPPETVLPKEHPRAEDKVLWYEGETGVGFGHAGLLVGRTAHRELWPQIFEWVRERLG